MIDIQENAGLSVVTMVKSTKASGPQNGELIKDGQRTIQRLNVVVNVDTTEYVKSKQLSTSVADAKSAG